MAPSTHHRQRQPTRERLLDAAVTLIARDGMDRLSHRRVEREAGLAHGSTTYYFRTRDELLREVITHLAELDRRTIAETLGTAPHRTAPAPERVVDDLVRVVETFLTRARAQTVARFELFLYAAREPSLQAELAHWRGQFEEVSAQLLRVLAPSEPAVAARTLVDSVDGLLFADVCLPGRTMPRERVHALLARFASAPAGT